MAGSSFPDRIGWLLKIGSIFGIIIGVFQQIFLASMPIDISFLGSGLFIRLFSICAILLFIGGFFLGKGIERRNEWARRALIFACFIFPFASSIPFFVMFMPFGMAVFSELPQVFIFPVVFLLISTVPFFYTAWRFMRSDTKKDFARKIIGAGNSYSKKSEFDAAIRNYDRAIKLFPGMGNAYRNRGYAHYKLGDEVSALDDFKIAFEKGVRTKWMVDFINSRPD